MTDTPALAYDVTVTLRNGHEITVPHWEGYQPDTIRDLIAHGGGVLALNTTARDQNIVRVDDIAAVHATPSRSIGSVLQIDGTFAWRCIGCGHMSGATWKTPGAATVSGVITHRCE